jgi:hypothetical protein
VQKKVMHGRPAAGVTAFVEVEEELMSKPKTPETSLMTTTRSFTRLQLKHLTAVCAVFLSITLSTSSALAIQSYPILCRGGHVSIGITGNRSGNGGGFVVLGFDTITFNHGGHSSGALEPGECGWADRPLWDWEPNVIYNLHDRGDAVQFGFWADSGTFSSSPTTGIPIVDAYINRMGDPNFYQWFWVYNNGNGHLVVTKIGY